MGRAVRRHPMTAGKQGRGGGGAQPRLPRQGARPQPRARGRFGLPPFLVDVVSELRKVTWPTRQDTTYLTVVVIIIAAAVGLFLGGIDILFNWIIENTLLR